MTVTITKEEFEAFIEEVSLQTGADWAYADEDGVGEYIIYLDKSQFPEDVVVRVCSSINTYTDGSRGTGEDSIKTMIWHTGEERPCSGKSYTQRIETWRKNLKPKVIECLSDWRSMITFCDECGSTMVIRTGPNGKFLGCSEYSDCEYTEPL